jgi:hypothetical protein
MTPGQTNRANFFAVGDFGEPEPWHELHEDAQQAWETAAQAVLEAHAPKPAQMTPLDEFAKAAMQGDLAAQTIESGFWSDADALAARAYSFAKAMMKEKNANN